MGDQSMQTIVKDVEKELLDAIINNLEEGTLTVEQAQALAREFLSLLPMEDKKDLLEKLHKLSQDYNETKEVYLKYAKPYEEEDRLKKLKLMSEHLQKGQIDHALEVAKGGTPNGSNT